MTTIKAFIKKHPVLTYFILTFAISWGGMLSVVWVGAGGFSITPEQLQTLVPYAVPAMIVGPSIAGLLLTGLVAGRAGLREFGSRLLKWRVGVRWYAVALLVTPLSIIWTIGFVYAAVTWVIVGAVALVSRGHLARPGKPPASVGSPQLRPR